MELSTSERYLLFQHLSVTSSSNISVSLLFQHLSVTSSSNISVSPPLPTSQCHLLFQHLSVTSSSNISVSPPLPTSQCHLLFQHLSVTSSSNISVFRSPLSTVDLNYVSTLCQPELKPPTAGSASLVKTALSLFPKLPTFPLGTVP
ncbi:hypothetical protein EMCRGX_G007059 [Ephydatia muelleri]